jgi:hypothetical protein
MRAGNSTVDYFSSGGTNTMKISNRTLFSTGAALFALSLAVHADVILRVDSSSVSSNYFVTKPIASRNFEETLNSRMHSFGDFSPFNANVNANFSDGGLLLNATADQSSEVTPTSISGRGSANANADGSLGEDSSTNATSFFSMDFELTSPTDFRLTGHLDADVDQDSDFFSTSSSLDLFTDSGAGFMLSHGDTSPAQIFLDRTGVLPAGYYQLRASAEANADIFFRNSTSSASEFSFLLEFPNESITVDPRPAFIPIPGAALLFGSGLLALLGRLRFRSA